MNDDLGPNKQRLFDVAATALPGDVLVDLGVRGGASSFAMLDATESQQCRVIGVDPAPCPFSYPQRYSYRQSDSVSEAANIEAPIFLCFFDTLHIKEQVMAELHHYWPKIRVGGWAVFHDSEWPVGKHDVYLGITWGQVIDGINAFFGTEPRPEITRSHHPESWGMTFIQKLQDWAPEVTGMPEALAASKLLTDALCK